MKGFGKGAGIKDDDGGGDDDDDDDEDDDSDVRPLSLRYVTGCQSELS